MSDDLRTTLLCFVCIVALAECVRWLQVMKGEAKQAALKIKVAKQAQEPKKETKMKEAARKEALRKAVARKQAEEQQERARQEMQRKEAETKEAAKRAAAKLEKERRDAATKAAEKQQAGARVPLGWFRGFSRSTLGLLCSLFAAGDGAA
jgi:outer membrane biosynthesis protein TonB